MPSRPWWASCDHRRNPCALLYLAAAAALFIALIASPPVAAGHAICNPRSAFVEHLKEKYDEQPLAFGLNNDGRLVELFGTLDGETWTLLITDARGISCVITSGEDWRKAAPKLLKPTGLPV